MVPHTEDDSPTVSPRTCRKQSPTIHILDETYLKKKFRIY